MAVQRKLTPELEREVALAYLCGIEKEVIAKKYEISDATIQTSILGKRSKEWNDPLVEFYRETNPENRVSNSAHLYLTFTSNLIAPGTELIDRQREGPVYDLVDEQIYQPGIEQIIRQTALRGYVDNQERSNFMSRGVYQMLVSPYEKLLQKLFWINNADRTIEIVTSALNGQLFSTYRNNSVLLPKKVFQATAYTIIQKVRNGGLAITPSKEKIINEILSKDLSDLERKVVVLRFGFAGLATGEMTLDEASKELHLNRNRVRQIEIGALSKVYRKLGFLASGLMTEGEAAAYLKNFQAQKERETWKQKLSPEIREEVLKEVALEQISQEELKRFRTEEQQRKMEARAQYGDKPISDLYEDLSVRTTNSLKSMEEIATIGNLISMTEPQLLRSKYFGRKCLKEIKDVLAGMGLELAK